MARWNPAQGEKRRAASARRLLELTAEPDPVVDDWMVVKRQLTDEVDEKLERAGQADG